MAIRFRCSNCQALMQVADQAAGQRTQCPSCKEIIAVPAKSQASTQAQAPKPSQPSQPVSSKPSAPATPPTAKAPPPFKVPAAQTVAQPTPAQASVPQVRCPHCRQLMRAQPGSRVQCPHCQKTIQVPGGTKPPAKPAGVGGSAAPAFPATTSLFDEELGTNAFPTGDYGVSTHSPAPGQAGGFGSFAGAPAPTYSPPASYSRPAQQSFNPYSPTAYAGTAYGASGSRNWQYVTLGVIFSLFGGLCILGVFSSLVLLVMTLVSDAPAQYFTIAVIRVVSGLVITLPLGIAYILGGLAFAQKTSLWQAKTAAILGCIPLCNGCILFPFGIWAAILVFGGQAKKDFSSN